MSSQQLEGLAAAHSQEVVAHSPTPSWLKRPTAGKAKGKRRWRRGTGDALQKGEVLYTPFFFISFGKPKFSLIQRAWPVKGTEPDRGIGQIVSKRRSNSEGEVVKGYQIQIPTWRAFSSRQ